MSIDYPLTCIEGHAYDAKPGGACPDCLASAVAAKRRVDAVNAENERIYAERGGMLVFNGVDYSEGQKAALRAVGAWK